MFTNSHAWCRSNQHPDAVVWNVIHSNLLSKARLLQWAYEILFCCGGRGVAEKCKENNYPPQTCCAKGTGVMRHINGSSSNILMKKKISYAPHNNLFHYLSLISLIWNKNLRLSTASLLKGRREGWGGTGALGIIWRGLGRAIPQCSLFSPSLLVFTYYLSSAVRGCSANY